MEGRADIIVMALIGILLIVGVVYLIKNWLLNSSFTRGLEIPMNEYIPDHPAVELLHTAGYEVLGGRVKIPLYFEVDDDSYQSRLFIDYVVSGENGDVYLVKMARHRKPLEWTGSGIRDQLLPYFLFYPDCRGVLYLDVTNRDIRQIQFDWDEEEWQGKDE
ncbi:hypothetical protein [Paenibacillus sp. IHBB 10380]|uniref:hypothetical protein n=1 Tax=Paenibacillus sp. IHBB 10380 TaxID=1566358 RepID=UPI0005CF94D0|nr:hypothetical protein [Paenibacillus sp. IHBB 10380]AJS57951.1 hypothetical protein UB51_04960 [Paenibacillus sp. IHBB 10380]